MELMNVLEEMQKTMSQPPSAAEIAVVVSEICIDWADVQAKMSDPAMSARDLELKGRCDFLYTFRMCGFEAPSELEMRLAIYYMRKQGLPCFTDKVECGKRAIDLLNSETPGSYSRSERTRVYDWVKKNYPSL